jgi:hypothetical protein
MPRRILETMNRTLTLVLALAALVVGATASDDMLIKRIPAGAEFLLTTNKGADVSMFEIQWYKDGQLLPGETGQQLRRPVASGDMNGVYTVSMSSPCAKVMSSPMQVIVGDLPAPINSTVSRTTFEGAAGINETVTQRYALHEAQPNPATDKATLTFTTQEVAPIQLRVVDLTGRTIATLVNETLPAGEHEVVFNIAEREMSNALYYIVLSAPGYTGTKSLLIAR